MSSNNKIDQLNLNLLHQHIDLFCRKHRRIKTVFSEIGYPDLYTRKPGFETLVKIILGQQVSLASALSAYLKLKAHVGKVTPKNVAILSLNALKACYFSKQKSLYIHSLCDAILNQRLDLRALEFQTDAKMMEELMKVKGIGKWTAEVYLIQALKRIDVFPLGDLAAINGLKFIFEIEDTAKIHLLIEEFKPYRTSLLFFAWHYYAYKKKLKIIL